MGWLITGGILFLLAVLPLGVRADYDEDGAQVTLLAGPFSMRVYPRKQKEEKKEPPKSGAKPEANAGESLPRPPQPPKQAPSGAEAKKGGSLTDFLPLARIALDFLGDFRRKLRLDEIYLRLILGGGDPCDLAVNYGRTWAAVGGLMPQLERLFVVTKRDIEVECDFTASKTLIIARLRVTITLGRLLALAVGYGIRALIAFLKIKKGGAET